MADKRYKKIFLICLSCFLVFIAAIVLFYFKGAECLVKSNFASDRIKSFMQSRYKINLTAEKPNFKTYLRPEIDFGIKKLVLEKDSKILFEIENLDGKIKFNKLFKKEIRADKLTASKIFLNTPDLLEALNIQNTEQENTKQQNLEYKIDIHNSNINAKELNLLYKQNNALINAKIKDLTLKNAEDYDTISFNLNADISKNNKKYAKIETSPQNNEIKIIDSLIKINSLDIALNDSKIKINSEINDNSLYLNAISNKFYLKDIFELTNSDIIIPEGETLLQPLANPTGYIKFNVAMQDDNTEGYVTLHDAGFKIKDLSLLPLKITNGKAVITKDKISLENFKGYWGKDKANFINVKGDIKDYYNSFDSNINIDTVLATEFFRDYLADLIGGTVLNLSEPQKTKIIYKSKNNAMDIVWLAKISKGVNLGTGNETSALSAYDRALKGDFHIEGDKIDIKNINYYIAPDIRKGVKLTPILTIDGRCDFMGNIEKAGFAFGREMPCEFLNIFTKKQTFKKGTIKGDLHVEFKDNIPYLNADMLIQKTIIPDERIFIKEAKLTTDNNLINFDLSGRFKKIKYDFKGRMKNGLEPPFVIKNMSLNLDKVDAEKLLESINNNGTGEPVNNTIAADSDGIVDDNYMFDTNLIRIENAEFSLQEGNYKDLTFGNIKALLTLDDKGILKLQSNKFDIAQGISTLKIECDLKNLKYYIRLGVKEVDSNLMTKTIFNLDKEISGLASGLIELNSDQSLKLNGNIKFAINDGTIGKIGLVEYVMKIASVFRNPIAMVSPGAIMDIISIPEGKFDKINGELKIQNNVVRSINIKSYSDSLSALIRGRFDMDKHDASLRIYTRFSPSKQTMFSFLRNISLNALANKVQMNTRNDAEYYASELVDLPQIGVEEAKTQIFLTQVEGDVEHNNFLSSLKKIK